MTLPSDKVARESNRPGMTSPSLSRLGKDVVAEGSQEVEEEEEKEDVDLTSISSIYED